MSAPARTSITVARSSDTQAILIVADAESAETDFLAGEDRYVALQGLDSATIREVADMLDLALKRRRFSTLMKIGGQVIQIGSRGASIVFQQNNRNCIITHDDAEDVIFKCRNIANHIDLKRS